VTYPCSFGPAKPSAFNLFPSCPYIKAKRAPHNASSCETFRKTGLFLQSPVFPSLFIEQALSSPAVVRQNLRQLTRQPETGVSPRSPSLLHWQFTSTPFQKSISSFQFHGNGSDRFGDTQVMQQKKCRSRIISARYVREHASGRYGIEPNGFLSQPAKEENFIAL
jgi:hypothetical protein